MVNLLGVALPTDLYPPGPENPAGYWESQHIVDLNEWLLGSAGASWSDCLSFAPEQLAGPGLPGIMASLVEAVKRVADTHALFVIKDPRLCLLLDLWVPALESLGIEVAVLMALRHPAAVAKSLFNRNGTSLPTGLALWLRYGLAAERSSRSVRRCIVSYDALLTDWRREMDRAGREIGLAWPDDPARVASEVEAFLRRELRHHDDQVSRPGDIPALLWRWGEDSHAALRALERSAADESAWRALDQVGAQFNAWCEARRRTER